MNYSPIKINNYPSDPSAPLATEAGEVHIVTLCVLAFLAGVAKHSLSQPPRRVPVSSILPQWCQYDGGIASVTQDPLSGVYHAHCGGGITVVAPGR